jgi:hypothetical protein
MLAWIAENAVTVIAIAVVLVLIGAAVASLVKDKKNSKGGCTGDCASCGMGCPYCHKK